MPEMALRILKTSTLRAGEDKGRCEARLLFEDRGKLPRIPPRPPHRAAWSYPLAQERVVGVLTARIAELQSVQCHGFPRRCLIYRVQHMRSTNLIAFATRESMCDLEMRRPRSVGKWQSPDSASPSKGPAWLSGFLPDCRRSVPGFTNHHKLFIVCRNTTAVYIYSRCICACATSSHFKYAHHTEWKRSSSCTTTKGPFSVLDCTKRLMCYSSFARKRLT